MDHKIFEGILLPFLLLKTCKPNLKTNKNLCREITTHMHGFLNGKPK